MKNNKFTVLAMTILLFAATVSCRMTENRDDGASAPAQPVVEASVEYLDFEEAIRKCTDVIRAEFVTYHEYERYRELEFKVLDVMKGSTKENTIYVFEETANIGVNGTDISYVSGTYSYEEGHEYLLVLERSVSVYYDHDRYMQLCDIYIPLADVGNSLMYGRPLSEHLPEAEIMRANTDLTEYIRENIDKAEAGAEFYGTQYSKSDDLAEVVEESSFIMQVRVEELLIVGSYNDTETFRCTVTKRLRGDLSYLSEEELAEGVLVVFPSGEASVGEEYLLLLNKVDDNSRIFSLSSEISIVYLDDGTSVDIINERVNND